MANRRGTALYTGVTSNLPQRIEQHRIGKVGHSARYLCKSLVWYEMHETMENAIAREKQIKAGSRVGKTALIVAMNPDWRDLGDQLL